MNIEHRTSNIERRPRGHWIAQSVLGVLAAGMVLSISSAAQETNAYPPIDSFQIIGRRNIFDPNRRGGEYFNHTNRVQVRRPDAFALVGTMSYSKGRFAFFDGSGSQFSKVIEPGEVIAGYTVKEVRQDGVTLAANGKEFEMKVGSQMRNEGTNNWQLSGHIMEEPAADEANDDTTAVESTAPPTGGSPQMNEVLKRLMEQRQQELK